MILWLNVVGVIGIIYFLHLFDGSGHFWICFWAWELAVFPFLIAIFDQ